MWNELKKMAQEQEYSALDEFVVNMQLIDFKEIYADVMNRAKHLIGYASAERKLEIMYMNIEIYGAKNYVSPYYAPNINTVVVSLPKFILEKKGIIDKKGYMIQDLETAKKNIKEIIYNDAKLYSVLIHEIMHGLQVESEIKPALNKDRKLSDLAIGKKYINLLDEQAANLESIFWMKKRGITKEEYKRAFFVETIRRIFDESGVDPNNITKDDFNKMRSLINKYSADYNVDPNISFEELRDYFFKFIKRLAMNHVERNNLFLYMMNNWDKVKLDRTEVPRYVWGGMWGQLEKMAQFVLDDKGEPKKMYHGTQQGFEEFDFLKGDKLGFHFGTLKQAHERLNQQSKKHQGKNIRPVYLKIQNPYFFKYDLGDWDDVEQLKEYFENEGDIFEEEEINNWKDANDIKKSLVVKGYDGIKYVNMFEDKNDGFVKEHDPYSYIAFYPEQITPAFGVK